MNCINETANHMLCQVLSSDIKKLHIDVYMENPYMLLLRTVEKKVDISFEHGRLLLQTGKGNVIVNIPLSDIKNCTYKDYGNVHEFLFNLKGVSYKLSAII